jgi:hypothetical protein
MPPTSLPPARGKTPHGVYFHSIFVLFSRFFGVPPFARAAAAEGGMVTTSEPVTLAGRCLGSSVRFFFFFWTAQLRIAEDASYVTA